MSEVGNDCPVCGRRLEGRTCVCGWGSADTEQLTPCQVCGAPTRLTQLTTASADPRPGHDDDVHKLHRCASCHFAYLKRRVELDPITPDALAACKALLASYYKRAEEKWATKR